MKHRSDKRPPGAGRREKTAPRGAPQKSTGAPERSLPFRRPSAELSVLYGFHAVREALRSKKRKLLTLYATQSAAARLSDEAAAAGLTPHVVEAKDLSRRLGDESVHQGVMLEARTLAPIDLSEIERKSGVVLVLDQVTDPHNVGAILRTAGAFAVDALVVTERHTPEFTGILAKAASGALEHVAIAEVVNLARALEELGEQGYTVVGLDSEAAQPIEECPLAKPVALVLGAEGKGLRRLTRERCDLLARLDTPGPIKSLNVSNACAVALSVLRRRLG